METVLPHRHARRADHAPATASGAGPGSRRDRAPADAGRSPGPRRPRRPSGQRPARPGQRPRAAGRSRPAPAVRPPSARDEARAAALAAPAPAPASFAELGLPGPVVTALAAQGIDAPFAIQARALPDALAGRDVLGRAQTGSGKTLAFGLPMLTRLAAGTGQPAGRPAPGRAPRGLVLVPTRELARQVAEVLAPLGRPVRVTVTTVYGGAPIGRQIDQLRRGTDIVVATPGRLIDLMERHAITLGQVEITVLDEADHMADLGFLPAVTRLLDDVPAGGQRMLFSATLDHDVDRLVTRYLAEPAVHAVAPVAAAAHAAVHQLFVLPAQDKLAVAAEIAARPGRTLFFVRTKHGADRLAKQLTRGGAEAAAIHGNLNQNQRQRALGGFAAGYPRVLVATDVAARGLHIDDVDLVVHFDPPNDHKDYLHRSGRTARAGATGTVLALADPAQVREVSRMHDAAGVTATRHQVQPGDEAVREIASSGTPIPPPPATPLTGPAGRAGHGRPAGQSGSRPGGRRPRPGDAPARGRRRGRPEPRPGTRVA
jgi:superfamily II DNA/RNA helicase